MRKAALGFLFVVLLGASFVWGSWYTERAVSKNVPPTGRKILYYVDPMHPAYKSDKPGIAPDCGMELVPVYADGTMAASGDVAVAAPGTVSVSAEKQQWSE